MRAIPPKTLLPIGKRRDSDETLTHSLFEIVPLIHGIILGHAIRPNHEPKNRIIDIESISHIFQTEGFGTFALVLEGFSIHDFIAEEDEFGHGVIQVFAVGDVVEGGVREIFCGSRDVSHCVLWLTEGFSRKARCYETFQGHGEAWS